MKQRKILISLLAFMLLVSPLLASAQTNTINLSSCTRLAAEGFRGVVFCVLGFFDAFLVILIAAAVVFVAYGAFQMIASEEKREEGKQKIYHGIIGLFVMVSIWGLVNILSNTFNLQGNYIPAPALRPPTGN